MRTLTEIFIILLPLFLENLMLFWTFRYWLYNMPTLAVAIYFFLLINFYWKVKYKFSAVLLNVSFFPSGLFRIVMLAYYMYHCSFFQRLILIKVFRTSPVHFCNAIVFLSLISLTWLWFWFLIAISWLWTFA